MDMTTDIKALMQGIGLAAREASAALATAPSAQKDAALVAAADAIATRAGTILATGFAITVPQRLALVAGVSHDDALTMIDYMTGTAGAVIAWIRAKGTDGYFGELGPQVADQLSLAFAQSASAALWAAALFLLLGLAGALAVERASRRVEAVVAGA